MTGNPEPLSTRIDAPAHRSRDINELIGVCKGALTDGAANLREAVFNMQWLRSHRKCLLSASLNEIWQ